MDVNEKVSYDNEDEDDFLDENEARMLDDDEEEEGEDEPELVEDRDDEIELEGEDEDTVSELACDASLDDSASATPYCPHGLMDILLPAIPPRPVNARVIRRLKD